MQAPACSCERDDDGLRPGTPAGAPALSEERFPEGESVAGALGAPPRSLERALAGSKIVTSAEFVVASGTFVGGQNGGERR